MKKCILMILGGLSAAVLAGSLNPPAAPTAGTMKTLAEVEPRIVINLVNTPAYSSYRFRISQPGSYMLAENVTIATDLGGIYVDADDVTIDLKGHRIQNTYTGTKINSGITLEGDRKNVVIQNGTVKGFYRAVNSSTYNSSGIQLIDLRALNNVEEGLYVYGFSSSTYSGGGAVISRCIAEGNGQDGIYAPAGATITDCLAKHNGTTGIYNAGNGTIRNCMAYYNLGTGIIVNGGSIVENNISSYNERGFYVNAGSTARGNTAFYNTGHGIETSNGCTVVENASYRNSSDGITLGIGCSALSNTAYDNGGYGITFKDACVIKNNTAYSNGTSGIFSTFFGSSVVGNAARDNQHSGIYVRQGLVDQNSAYDNNKSGGTSPNLYTQNCTLGANYAP